MAEVIVSESVYRNATWSVVRTREVDGSVALRLIGEHSNGHYFMSLPLGRGENIVFNDPAPCAHKGCPGEGNCLRSEEG